MSGPVQTGSLWDRQPEKENIMVKSVKQPVPSDPAVVLPSALRVQHRSGGIFALFSVEPKFQIGGEHVAR